MYLQYRHCWLSTINDHLMSFSTTDVEAVLSQINVHNSASPDGIRGRVHRACTGELAGS